MQSPGPQASSAPALALPCSSPGAHSCSGDPLSITTLPRLLTLLLTLATPSISHTLPPAALALRQLLPTTAALKACSEPRHTSRSCSSEVAHWSPNPSSASGSAITVRTTVPGGSRAGANGAALRSCHDQPLDLAAWGAWPLQPGSAPHPPDPPILTASPRDYSGFPVFAPLPQVHWVQMCKVRDSLGADHRVAHGALTENVPGCPSLGASHP